VTARAGGAGGTGATARDVARRVLDRVDRGGAWATPALDGELARAGLDERDRRLAAELVYGVLRNRARIDRALATHADLGRTPPRVVTALRVAAYQLLFLDRVPGYAAVDDAVRAARGVAGPRLAGFCNAVLRKLAAAGEPALPDDPRDATRGGVNRPALPGEPPEGGHGKAPLWTNPWARIAIEHSLPEWITDELAAAAPDRLDELAAALARPAPLIARANRRRTTRDALIAELAAAGATARPIAEAAMAIAIDGLGDPARSASFRAGRWTVQDTGAQRVGLIAAPRAGQRILDACAGVGGKSTHLAELADDAAVIDAADQLAGKLDLARETAARLGLTSIRPVVCDLLDPAAPLAAAYDLIVLDAPCSGLGVLRRHPDAKWRLVPADVPRLTWLQRRLLDAVVPRLAPGGALVYSVCTFTRAEGPDQVAALVERTGLRLVEDRRTWPPDADAFYIARLER
jgi:16S rRNA (cytosine967-C5)-methyltransferase